MSPTPKIRENHCLVQANCLAVPAIAEAWTQVEDLDALHSCLDLVRRRQWPLLPMGSGSNLVLADRIPGLVMHMALSGRQVEERPHDCVRVRVAAGENWHELVSWCVERGYYGIENLALIPGTAGAAPMQNIGAYGVELEECFHSLEAVEIATGETCHFSRAECGFRYRYSRFKDELANRFVITKICLELSRQPAPRADYPSLASCMQAQDLAQTPENVFAAVCQVRRDRIPDPAAIPNVGSFFQNPILDAAPAQAVLARYPQLAHWVLDDGRVKFAAAALIEAQGWKGRLRKGVGVHERHALVLVNPGHESGAAVLAFAREIQQSVQQAYGIDLQIEPRCYPD